MSNTGDQETGGASIIPSARPSIHDHGCCPFAYSEAMGRYGIEKNNKRERRTHKPNQSNDYVSTDEVDNVFSKPIYTINPSSLSQSDENLRKSFDDDDDDDDDEQETAKDSSKLLSKSLPATFSPHSYCSNERGDAINIRNENQYSDISYQSSNQGTPLANTSPIAHNRRTPVTNRSYFNRSGSVSLPHASTPPHLRQTKASRAEESSKMLLPLLFLVGFIVTVASMFNTTNLTRPVIYDESRFYHDIDLLGNKYQIDENAVLQMQTGIAAIVERQDTGSFMFVYNSNVGNFHPKEFNTFVNDVSNTVSKYLRNESTPIHYTLVEGSTLEMNSPGELISTFREDLYKTGVMLVKHVEAIPSTLAMAFHFYCDEYNPLVKKSAIFFTLNLAECSEAAGQKPTHAVIEKCLAKKWNSVAADSIGPLLTRVVSVVIDVTSAF